MDDISRRRWEREPDPAKFDPKTAIQIASEELQKRDDLKHIIVVYVDQNDVCGWYQAGTLDKWAQPGLMQYMSLEMQRSE